MLPDVTQVADPFHVVILADSKLDETRRRVQNETLGHRGRKGDPLYRIRRLLTKPVERLTDQDRTKLVGLLAGGDPEGEVTTACQAKEAIRQIYNQTDADLAVERVERHGRDLQDSANPPEVRSLGRTLIRWKDQIAAWHKAHVSNRPTEAANNLIKRVAFGFRRFHTYRIRFCSTQENPTGAYSPPSHPPEIRSARYILSSSNPLRIQGSPSTTQTAQFSTGVRRAVFTRRRHP